MKYSQKYLEKHTDSYANFHYKMGRGGSYSEAGIEVEYAEVYGKICELEGMVCFIDYLFLKSEYPSKHTLKALKKEYQKELKKLSK